MREKSCSRACSAVPDLLQSRRKSGFAERADGQARKRDADLHAGNNTVQIRQQTLDNARADVALGHELANAGKPHSNEGKLRGGEKAVEGDERQHTDQPHGEHSFSGNP